MLALTHARRSAPAATRPYVFALLSVPLLSLLLISGPFARAGDYSDASYSGGSYTTDGGGSSTPDDRLTGGGYGMNFQNGACSCADPIIAAFKWSDLNNAADPPPQYVVVAQSASVAWHGVGPGGATGSASSGLGDVYVPYSSTANLPPGWEFDSGYSSTPSDALHYSLKPGGQTVTLDPVTMTGSAGPSQTSGLIASYTAAIYPIALASIVGNNDNLIFNPMGRPDLGDGSNQYVYTADTPDGYLYVPGAYQAVGGNSSVQQWLIDNNIGDLKIENSNIPNALAHLWLNTGSSVAVNTPDNGYPSYQANKWIFKGLPTSNNRFGNHDVNLYVHGSQVQTASIQTFFNGVASNWPGTDGVMPNWYNYYPQIWTPFSSSNPVQYGKSSSSSDVSLTSNLSPFTVTLKDSAYSSSYNTNELRVFDIMPNYPKYVRLIGYLTVPSGIMQYIHAAAHERGHQSLFQMGTDGPVYTDATDPLDYNSSEDGDIVSDNWEAIHRMNAAVSDTTRAYSNSGANDSGDGDGEFLADIQALPVLFSQLLDYEDDWANGGVQWGTLTYPYFSPTTPGAAPAFSLTFTPASADSQGSWTYTGPSKQVQSVSDIQSYYKYHQYHRPRACGHKFSTTRTVRQQGGKHMKMYTKFRNGKVSDRVRDKPLIVLAVVSVAALTASLSSGHHFGASPTNASPIRGVFLEEAQQMAGMRIAGLERDRSQVPALIAVLTNPLKPRQLAITSFQPGTVISVVEHPALVKTALHALAQIGATEALPTIDADLSSGSIEPGYARVERARLVAEDASSGITDPLARASTKISRFYTELGLTTADLNTAAAQYQQARASHSEGEPPVGVYAMREIADMAYCSGYSSYAGLPGVSQLDLSPDYPAQLKMKLAPLSSSDRAIAIILRLAQKKYRGLDENFDLQLAADQGTVVGTPAAAQLQTMTANRNHYPKEGFDLVMTVLSSIGDKQQAPVIESFRHDPDPEIAEFARSNQSTVQKGVVGQFAPGY